MESFSLYELLSAVDSFQLTVSWIIGHVLTHSGDSFHICSLFPVKFLTLICQEALTPDCIDRFFRVCSCSYDSVQFSIMENDQVVSHTHHDIEVSYQCLSLYFCYFTGVDRSKQAIYGRCFFSRRFSALELSLLTASIN